MSENTEYDHKETKQLSESKRPGFGEMSESVKCLLCKYEGLSLDPKRPHEHGGSFWEPGVGGIGVSRDR